mgnify:CR=1 FL=1
MNGWGRSGASGARSDVGGDDSTLARVAPPALLKWRTDRSRAALLASAVPRESIRSRWVRGSLRRCVAGFSAADAGRSARLRCVRSTCSAHSIPPFFRTLVLHKPGYSYEHGQSPTKGRVRCDASSRTRHSTGAAHPPSSSVRHSATISRRTSLDAKVPTSSQRWSARHATPEPALDRGADAVRVDNSENVPDLALPRPSWPGRPGRRQWRASTETFVSM